MLHRTEESSLRTLQTPHRTPTAEQPNWPAAVAADQPANRPPVKPPPPRIANQPTQGHDAMPFVVVVVIVGRSDFWLPNARVRREGDNILTKRLSLFYATIEPLHTHTHTHTQRKYTNKHTQTESRHKKRCFVDCVRLGVIGRLSDFSSYSLYGHHASVFFF